MTSAWRSDGGIASTTAWTALQVGVARVGRRRADGDEQQPRVLERVGDVGREVQPLAVLAATSSARPGLVDRDLAALEALDLVGVDVDAPDLVAELGEAGRRDEADVAGADDADGFALPSHAAAKASGSRTPVSGADAASASARCRASACS